MATSCFEVSNCLLYYFFLSLGLLFLVELLVQRSSIVVKDGVLSAALKRVGKFAVRSGFDGYHKLCIVSVMFGALFRYPW